MRGQAFWRHSRTLAQGSFVYLRRAMRLRRRRQEPREIHISVGEVSLDDDALSAEIWIDGEEYAFVTLAPDGKAWVRIYGLRSERDLPLEEVMNALSTAEAELKQ